MVPAINVPGVKAGELTLSGEVLGDIYLGKIKKWNDPGNRRVESEESSCRIRTSPWFAAPTARAPASC